MLWNPIRNCTVQKAMHDKSLEIMNLMIKNIVDMTGKGEHISSKGYFLL
jgi:hypothetical protein